jgi:hypothetical protein
VLLGIATIAMVMPAAAATHLANYRYQPVERDDQGTVLEPDGLASAVAGAPLENCAALPAPGAACVPDSQLPPPGGSASIAPGCTDAQGQERRSGECGMATTGLGIPGPAGLVVQACGPGASLDPCPGPWVAQGSCPGRFTPTPTSQVRFLDARAVLHAQAPVFGVSYVDHNRKLDEPALQATLGQLDPDLGQPLVPPTAGLWAWFGAWQDKNCNGVVDEREGSEPNAQGRCPAADGCVHPENEFVWQGRCRTFEGYPAPPGQRYCALDNVTLPVWVWPGDHHGTCSTLLSVLFLGCGPFEAATGDLPGSQAACFVALVAGAPLEPCADAPGDVDRFDEEVRGDPLLGPQGSLRADGTMADRTGDWDITTRMWTYGQGVSTRFYDQSLLVATVTVVGATHEAVQEDDPLGFDPAALVAVDIDAYPSWSPEVGSLLQDTVKPALRSTWVLVRDGYAGPLQVGRDGVERNRLLDDGCDTTTEYPGAGVLGCPTGASPGPAAGRAAVRVLDPGWAHEPNHPLDVAPGARFQAVPGCAANATRAFLGWCNDYATGADGAPGYQGAWRAWLDLRALAATWLRPAWRMPFGDCFNCVLPPPDPLPSLGAGYVRPEGDRTRVLQPGSHVLLAAVGAWRDQAHDRLERSLDFGATLGAAAPQLREHAYAAAPDAWVGDVVERTGALRSRGYGPEACPAHGPVALHEYAVCHPDRDGRLDDPNGYEAGAGGEFRYARFGPGGPFEVWQASVRPVDGQWDVPVFLWRNFSAWRFGQLQEIQDFTGRAGAAADIRVALGLADEASVGPGGANLVSRDLLVLPRGNPGEPVTTLACGRAAVPASAAGPAVAEEVCDGDAYGPWGG